MQAQGSFIGHIGGDDFVFIMDLSLVEDTAKEILDAFDRIIPTLYEAEDRERGYIEIKTVRAASDSFLLSLYL